MQHWVMQSWEEDLPESVGIAHGAAGAIGERIGDDDEEQLFWVAGVARLVEGREVISFSGGTGVGMG